MDIVYDETPTKTQAREKEWAHLNTSPTTTSKSRTGIAPRHSGDSDPGQDLEKVVWERHKVEAIASWYRPLPRSGGPKGTKGEVGMQVRDLSKLVQEVE